MKTFKEIILSEKINPISATFQYDKNDNLLKVSAFIDGELIPSVKTIGKIYSIMKNIRQDNIEIEKMFGNKPSSIDTMKLKDVDRWQEVPDSSIKFKKKKKKKIKL